MAPNFTDDEKRAYDRIPEEVAVEARQIVYPPENAADHQGLGQNISAGGICFTSATPFPQGELLSLRIRLTGWQRHKRSYAAVIDDDLAIAPLTAVTRVAWSRPRADGQGYDIGVTFVDIYPDDYQALKRYLAPVDRAGA
jgi:hypothetical protein